MSQVRPLIALDTRGLEPGFKAHFGRGTGRYVECITRELKQINPTDIELRYLGSKDLKVKAFQEKVLSLSPLGKTTLECQYFFPKNIQQIAPDLMHFFAHGDAPAFPRSKQIVSILDLIPLRFPEMYKDSSGGLRFRFARFLENRSAKASIGIIAISEATKRDVISLLNIPEDSIFVTPLGIDPKFFVQANDPEDRAALKAECKKSLGLKQESKILLYVGGIDPRKNIKFLLAVFKEALADLRGKNLILALAGPILADKHYPEFKAAIDDLDLKDSIKLFDFLPDEELRKLMLAADIFTFPSLYEGFGLPILEALSVGLPVIAGNNSSVPEVMGKQGIMLNDFDKIAWVQNILELTNSEIDSNSIHQLQNERIAHAKQFTWRNTAKLTLEAYKYFIDRNK